MRINRYEYYHLTANVPGESTVKVSYSASSNWHVAQGSNRWKSIIREVVDSYRAISVREKAGVELLQKNLPHRTISRTIDPVLLLDKDHYMAMLPKKKIFKKSTMFCYLLHYTPELWDIECLKKIAEILEVELKICGIQGTEDCLTDANGVILSPIDFLRAFRDAKYVITNSFHGTVFSALFEVPWISIPQTGCPIGQNIRSKEFLSDINHETRFVSGTIDEMVSRLLEQPDWGEIKEKISAYREFSRNWLLDAVEIKDSKK